MERPGIEPRSFAQRSGMLTITLNCACVDLQMDPNSCKSEFVQFI